MFIDTHCHINIKDYPNLDEVIKQMDGNIIIVSGYNDASNHEVIDLCNQYDNVYGTLGIHPEEADHFTEEAYDYIESNLKYHKIVGVGEIGLDYYWRHDNIEQQKTIFIKQIRLARKYNKAFVIHSREAIADTYQILYDEKFEGMRPVIHCFSSSVEMAQKFIKLGAMLGVGGVITFKNSLKLKEVVSNIDLNYLLLETDSPYLSPEPFRGKQNVPYNVHYVAKMISEIQKIPYEKVISQTTFNAIHQFDLKLNL
jgi:TatD DNase family protein